MLLQQISQTVLTIIVAVLVLFMGLILGLVLRKLIKRLLGILKLNDVLYRLSGVKTKMDVVLSWAVAMAVYAITIYLVLGKLGILRVAGILFFSCLGVLFLLWLLFGAKDAITNYFAGRPLRKHLHVGSAVSFGSIKGIVQRLGACECVLRSGDELYVVPYIIAVSPAKKKRDKSVS
ncbi:MAG: hypothetical protein V1725_04255 [archaeon]